jgi:hypothetical protein
MVYDALTVDNLAMHAWKSNILSNIFPSPTDVHRIIQVFQDCNLLEILT